MKIGLIGNGNFGKLCVKELSPYADIKVWDISGDCDHWIDVATRDNIILAVPMRELRSVCEELAPGLSPGQRIIDICSLKTFSTEIMEEVFPDFVDLVHTHPLFGPQSAKNGIAGQRIVFCPSKSILSSTKSRKSSWKDVAAFCMDTLKLKVIESSAEEHDRQMAVSQALTHFIGRIAERMDLDRGIMPTKSFEDLMNIIDLVKGSKKELFIDMQTLNPQAAAVRAKFIKEAFRLNLDIEEDRF